jgi:hypothetical protein
LPMQDQAAAKIPASGERLKRALKKSRVNQLSRMVTTLVGQRIMPINSGSFLSHQRPVDAGQCGSGFVPNRNMCLTFVGVAFWVALSSELHPPFYIIGLAISSDNPGSV